MNSYFTNFGSEEAKLNDFERDGSCTDSSTTTIRPRKAALDNWWQTETVCTAMNSGEQNRGRISPVSMFDATFLRHQGWPMSALMQGLQDDESCTYKSRFVFLRKYRVGKILLSTVGCN